MKSKWTAITLGCLIVLTACDDNDDNKKALPSADKTFVQDVARGNLTEMEFGALAATKGNSEMVRTFGEKMVTEHTTAQNELRGIANDYSNVDWPDGLDNQHQQIREKLMNLSGYSFDSLYMNSQVMDHEMTMDLFENEMSAGTEQKVKAFGDKYYPHIQEHHMQADSILNVLISNPGSK